MQKKKKNFTISPDFSVSSLPRVIRIEPSSLCNLRCIHCPNREIRYKKKGNMSWNVFSKIINEIKKYNEVDVIVLYHGGEPFLNKDIFKMIKTVKSLGTPFVKTVTNGTLINDEMLTKIIESNLDSIEFSIDGLSPEENNSIRRGADYYQVVSIIEKLLLLKRKKKSLKPEVYITNTQIPTKADILRKKKVSIPQYLLDDFSDFKNEVKFKNTYMIKWPGFTCSSEYFLVEAPVSRRFRPSSHCDNVIELITFRWNGDVVPCCYDITSEYVIGNIMENSLEEIWNNRRYKKIRQTIHLRKYIPLCRNCNVIRPQLFVAKK